MLAQWLNRNQPEWLEHMRLGAPFSVGPTGAFALAIFGAWRPGAVFVQLITKIDESGTHQGADYMTMAGYTARLGQWNRLDHKWRKTLRKAGLEYFHVKEHGGLPVALKLPKVADDNAMFGFVVRLDGKDYRKHYREGGWGGKAQPDSMYGLCFRYCLSLVLQVALDEMLHEGLVLNFLVEDGHPNAGAANEIVRVLKQKRIRGVSEFLGTADTGDKKKHPGLQAADGLASGAWHLEAAGVPQLPPPQKPSLLKWKSVPTDWKAPLFRCHIDESELAKFKRDYFAHIEFRRQFGANPSSNALPSSGASASGEPPPLGASEEPKS